MTYKIYYNSVKVFDIEFWQNYFEEKDGVKKWYSEISVSLVPEGIIPLSRSIKEEDVITFIKDTEEIDELRAELYEGGELWALNNYIANNGLEDAADAEERHYKVIKPEIEKRLQTYCDKYGLSYSVD